MFHIGSVESDPLLVGPKGWGVTVQHYRCSFYVLQRVLVYHAYAELKRSFSPEIVFVSVSFINDSIQVRSYVSVISQYEALH